MRKQVEFKCEMDHFLLTLFCAIVWLLLFTVSAQAETAYRTWEGEPVNGYTIKREVTYLSNVNLCCSLICSKGSKEVVLDERYYYDAMTDTLSIGGECINEQFITDGETVYYSVIDNENKKTTIYKTSISGKNRIKVKTLRNIYDWYNLRLITIYDRKLYYTFCNSNGYQTFEYDLETKRTKHIIKCDGYEGVSGYGANIIMSEDRGQYPHNVKNFSYNVKTKKKYSWPASMYKFITADAIYYELYTTKDGTKYGSLDRYNLYKCSIKGNNKKKLLSFKAASGDWITEINRKFIKYEKNGKIKKLYLNKV